MAEFSPSPTRRKRLEMRFIDGEVYLNPCEAASFLGISYKTLQRWVEAGERKGWGMVGGKRVKVCCPIQITPRFTMTGYRLYKQSDIGNLLRQFDTSGKVEPPLEGKGE